MKTFHPSWSVSRHKPSAHRTTFLKRATSDKQPKDSPLDLVERLCQCRILLVDRLSTRLSVRSIDGCREKAIQVDRIVASDSDPGAVYWANEVVNKGLHHRIGCPLGRLQHADVEVRRQKRDRLRVIIPQLIDDQRFVSSLVVGSKVTIKY